MKHESVRMYARASVPRFWEGRKQSCDLLIHCERGGDEDVIGTPLLNAARVSVLVGYIKQFFYSSRHLMSDIQC